MNSKRKGKAAKRKGKVGEREAAKFISKFGFDAHRGQQYAGSKDSPDVVHNIPKIHIEVKRNEALQIWPALRQAISDAAGLTPVVMHRCNKSNQKGSYPKGEWIVIMLAEDFFNILKEK